MGTLGRKLCRAGSFAGTTAPLTLFMLSCASTPIGTANGHASSRFAGKGLTLLSPASSTSTPSRYEVRAGDTLWSLARRFNTTVDRLMVANQLDRPENLLAGDHLIVPTTNEPTPDSVAPKSPEPSPPPTIGTSPTQPAPSPKGAPPAHRQTRTQYRLQWPAEGTISTRFGHRGGRHHDGIDISAAAGGPVRAAADGEILFSAAKGGYGNLILIRHSLGLITVYAHNARNLVRPGQRVRAGQIIARVGQTGRATGPHLHFEVRRGIKPENPLTHLPP